jgi:hypothetical protein
VTPRYKIIGTIYIDAQPAGASAASGPPVEQALLSLAVTDALGDAPAWQSRRLNVRCSAGREPALIPADLDALAAELQTAWDELETGAM